MEHAVALYSYEGLTEQELSFSKNDVFKILDRENQDWWFVESETQKQGYVPTTYVKPYEYIQLDSEHEGRQEVDSEPEGPQDIQVDSEPEDPQDSDDDEEHHMDNAEHGKLI
jgi:hypothetical protein